MLLVEIIDEKQYIQKKKNERKKYIMGYEYALLEQQRNRHTKCSQVEITRGWQTGTWQRWSSDDPAALPTTWCQLQEPSPFSVSCHSRRKFRKMQSVTMAKGKTMGEPGSCCCYFHLDGLFFSHGGHGGPGGHFCWLTGGGHGWGGQGSWDFCVHTFEGGWQGSLNWWWCCGCGCGCWWWDILPGSQESEIQTDNILHNWVSKW